jgi:hypothetical protein
MTAAPPTTNQTDRPTEDELDGLLRAFYMAELPNPWPSLKAPAPRSFFMPFRPAAPRFPMLRTRLALAACVAFLVAGPLLLSAYFSRSNQDSAQTTTPSALPDGSAIKVKPGEEGYQLIQKDGRTWIKVDGTSGK